MVVEDLVVGVIEVEVVVVVKEGIMEMVEVVELITWSWN